MVVHLYALNYNEINLLPFFFQHYDSIVDHYFIFDDRSDDGSIEYLQSRPNVTLKTFEHGAESYVLPATDFYNQAWKASRGVADWIIIVNIDEHIHHPRFRETLAALRGRHVTAVQCRGWEMVSQHFPESGPLRDSVPNGVRYAVMDKIAVFDPNAIEETNFSGGRHSAAPKGWVKLSHDDDFKLLHYKCLGLDYVSARYRELNARRGPVDVAKGLGHQYAAADGYLARRQKRLESAARPVTLLGMERAGQLTEVFPGCFLTKSRAVANERGGLREVWAQGDAISGIVNHVYTTTTLPGIVKAWYRHRLQTDNITVLSGTARFALYDTRTEGQPALRTFDLTADEPQVLTIPPGVWHGFSAIGEAPLVMLHLNDRLYDWTDTDEEKIDADHASIPHSWAQAAS
ncbi:hypothetical protein ASG52_13190 [Methylobacterium sp. Leaf456]|nr:hypothetical protein ASG52_13190 [Methylobacterium sp. Leaf456]